MICPECRERLLEADPRIIASVLAGRGDSTTGADDPQIDALTDHLRACIDCRASAQRILAADERLAERLEALKPVRPLDEALAAAIRESHRRRRRFRAASGTVAAAALVGLLAVRVLNVETGAGTNPAEVMASLPATSFMPEVEALLDESVLVLETDNEDVVVFWFYEGRGE